MKAGPLVFAALFGSLLPGAGAVLFSDNFDTADSASFDAAGLAGRLAGTVAGETYLRSWGTQQQINSNQLLMPTRNSGGVRFETALNDPTSGAADRYNWAAGLGGAAILAAGGFTVTFDWIPVENTLTDWVSFQVGTNNADSGNLAAPGTDHGILFRNNGATERFDNGVNLGAGGSFPATAGGVSRQIQIDYSFSSFADGAPVTATSFVNGQQVASDSFSWAGNGGEMRMELGSISANSRVDNLVIATIPEASALPMLGLAGAALLRRRRA